MDISLNLDFFNQLMGKNPLEVAWFFFVNGGWIVFLIAFWTFIRDSWLYMRQVKYAGTIEYMFLAVDIPSDNEQMPKAVEQIFATIAGAHSPLTKGEVWWEGKFQLKFSFEIISIEGYLQYIIRTPRVWEDLVKSAIYAQYPQAEITEVEDYTKDMPNKFPDDKYNLWGAELIPAGNQFFPIRTYMEFEEKLMGEFKDPMAAILETMNNIRPGEQVWLQYIIAPTDTKWSAEAKKFSDKLAGKKAAPSKPVTGPLSSILTFFGDWATYHNTLTSATKEESSRREEPVSRMLYLTPIEKEQVEAVERKAAKIGFECKIRLIYIGPKEIFNAQRVVSAVFGAIKQFNTHNMGALKPDNMTKTTAYYGLASRKKNIRRTKIIRNYKARDSWAGRKPFILNVEELATLYHYPIMTVKAPLMPKLEMKKGEPPSYLPTSGLPFGASEANPLREELDRLNINNDYYERRYGLKRDRLEPKKKETKETVEESVPTNLPIA